MSFSHFKQRQNSGEVGEVVTKDYMDAQLCQFMYFYSSCHLHMEESY